MAEESSMWWKLGLNNAEFVSKLGESVEKTGDFAEKLHKAFEVVEGGALIVFLEKLISKGAEIKTTAEQLEVTTDSVQALNFAAANANVSTETLQNALGHLKIKSAEAAEGNAQANDALKKLNINAAEFVNLPVDRQLESIAKAADSAEDRSAAFAAITELLGAKAAPRLTAMLKELAEQGLDGTTASAKSLGQVIESGTIDRMEKLENRIGQVKNGFVTFGATVLEGWGKIADLFGTAAAVMVNSVQGIDTSLGGLDEKLAKGEAALEKLNVTLKGTKASSEEIAKAQEAQAKAQEAATLAAMESAEKIAYFQDKVINLAIEKTKYDANTKEALKLQTDIMETQAKLAEQVKKEREETTKVEIDRFNQQSKQLDAERAEMTTVEKINSLRAEEAGLSEDLAKLDKDSKEYAAEHNRLLEVQKDLRAANTDLAKQHKELAELLLKGEGNLNDAETEKVKLLRGQTTEKKQQAEIDALLAKGVQNLTEEEKKRLGVLIGHTTELKTQFSLSTATMEELKSKREELNKKAETELETSGKVTEETQKQLDIINQQIDAIDKKNKFMAIGSFNANKKVTELSDRELAELRKNLEDEEFKWRGQVNQNAYGKDWYAEAFADTAAANLKNVQDEINYRAKFRQQVGFEGLDAAISHYSAFDEERLKNYVRPEDEKQNALNATNLQDIADRLTGKKPIFKAA